MKCKNCKWIIWNNADDYEICEQCNKNAIVRQIYDVKPRLTKSEKQELSYLLEESDRLWKYSEVLDECNDFHE